MSSDQRLQGREETAKNKITRRAVSTVIRKGQVWKSRTRGYLVLVGRPGGDRKWNITHLKGNVNHLVDAKALLVHYELVQD